MLRLIFEIHQIRDTRLHAIGHLVLRDPGVNFEIPGFHFFGSVDLGNSIEHISAHIA